MTAAALAALAVVLSGPVPAGLARATGVRSSPRAALTLWQAVAAAAVLSALGAALTARTGAGFGSGHGPAGRVVAAVALLVTGVVLGRLLVTGHRVGSRLRSVRRQHRELIDVLAAEGEGFVVVQGDAPVAYCLPGIARRRVVISSAAAALPADQLEAVLAHERAHLAARHDLVLETFTVLHEAFPRHTSSARALSEVRLLVEVLADAAARRRCGALPLARALVALTGSPVPTAALGAGGGTSELTARIRLLTDDTSHRALGALLYVAALTVLVLPTVFLAQLWVGSLPS